MCLRECINTRGETRNRPICVVKQPICSVSAHTLIRQNGCSRVQLQFCIVSKQQKRQRAALLLRRLHLPLHKNVMSTLKILNGMKYTRRSRHINSWLHTHCVVCAAGVGWCMGSAPVSTFYINISAALPTDRKCDV